MGAGPPKSPRDRGDFKSAAIAGGGACSVTSDFQSGFDRFGGCFAGGSGDERAAVAGGDDLGDDRQGDFGGGAATEIEADRAVDTVDLGRGEAFAGETFAAV